MGFVVPHVQGAFQTNLPATPSSTAPGTTVTGSGSTHTKGSYSPLIDPVTYESTMLMLMIKGTATAVTVTDTLLDIAIGPTGGGSEQIIIPDILVGWSAADDRSGGRFLNVPILIPKGVRVSARCQSVTASKTVDVIAYLLGGTGRGAWPTYAGCDVYGINAATSRGTSVTAGNSGAEGSWTSVGSATSRPYKAIQLMKQGNIADTTQTNNAFHWEVGTGSGAEIFGEWFTLDTTAEESQDFPHFPLPRHIPTGTQLQVRGECGGTAEVKDVALYCFY